jgi:peptidoglycan hydrolase-like protein with peptidoglycan-binding domain
MTAEAVRKYQKKKGYTQTGNATPALQQEIAKATGNSSSVVSGTLKKGSSGSAVEALQTALMKLGYYYGDITGNYGDLTAKAVRRYQSDHGLTADGVAGPATIASINGRTDMNISAGISTSTTGTMTAYATITGNNVTMRKGAGTNYDAVAKLSYGTTMKISKSVRGKDGFTWYYGTTTNMDTRYSGYVRIDYLSLMSRSVYDETTGKTSNYIGMLEVVKSDVAIREGPGKDESVVGRVDKGEQFYYKSYSSNGWYQLTGSSYVEGAWIIDDCVKLISWGGSGGSIYLGTLKFGDSGDAVRQLQMKLSMLGYYTSTISGTFGRLTENAVSDFQSDHGLNDDGIAGPETLNAIEDAVSSKINKSDITVKSTVYDLPWNNVDGDTRTSYGVRSGALGTILDLATGKAFSIVMRWGTEHMDAEPYNARATEILCEIYGVDSANQLPSDRNKARPMLVQTEKGYQIVCTLYPVPHDSSSQTITNNNFNGVFCIHFTGTRTHGGNVVHTEYTSAINLAKSLLKNMGRTVTTITD